MYKKGNAFARVRIERFCGIRHKDTMASEERRQLAEGGGVGEEFSVLPALYFFSVVVVFNTNLFQSKVNT